MPNAAARFVGWYITREVVCDLPLFLYCLNWKRGRLQDGKDTKRENHQKPVRRRQGNPGDRRKRKRNRQEHIWDKPPAKDSDHQRKRNRKRGNL